MWFNQNQQTLFCPGIPGAGKRSLSLPSTTPNPADRRYHSFLASIVIQHLWEKFRYDASVGIAYLYCDFRRQQEQKPIDLLASLLKQLVKVQHSMPEILKNLYKFHKNQRTRPSIDEISKILRSVVSNYSRVFFIVDALDKCQNSDKDSKRLLSEIFNIQASTGANFFATARFIPDIIREFKTIVILDIRANDEDIRMYLDGKLSKLRSFVSRNLRLQGIIKAKIVQAADGM